MKNNRPFLQKIWGKQRYKATPWGQEKKWKYKKSSKNRQNPRHPARHSLTEAVNSVCLSGIFSPLQILLARVLALQFWGLHSPHLHQCWRLPGRTVQQNRRSMVAQGTCSAEPSKGCQQGARRNKVMGEGEEEKNSSCHLLRTETLNFLWFLKYYSTEIPLWGSQ